ncbi:MAG: hypothetical protein Q8P77_00790 [Candidatus Veblenbacteria bacterium]|nr:hypothetical protein [Candidatus Veblenbacteria bacterium]
MGTQKKVLVVASGYSIRESLRGQYEVFGYEVTALSRFGFSCIDWSDESFDLMVIVTTGVEPGPDDLEFTHQIEADDYRFYTEIYYDTHSPP